MDDKKNCTVCNLKTDNNNYKKDRTIRKNCCNKKNEIYNKFSEKETVSRLEEGVETPTRFFEPINFFNNGRSLIVGPSFSVKTCFMFIILSRILNWGIYIFTKSPLEHYSNSKIKIKEIGEVIRVLNHFEYDIIFFDDVLGSSNCKYIDQFFMRRGHKSSDIHYLSQSYFDSKKRTIKNQSF